MTERRTPDPSTERPGIGSVLGELTQLYLDGLLAIGRAVSDLGLRRMPESQRQLEHWISVARMAKDSYVAAIDQGFEIWESQLRRLFGASRPARRQTRREKDVSPGPLDGLIENWRRAGEVFTDALRSGGVSEDVLDQADEFRRTVETGLGALRALFSPPDRD